MFNTKKNFVYVELMGNKILIESGFSKNASSEDIAKLINITTNKDEIIKSLIDFSNRNESAEVLQKALNTMINPKPTHQIEQFRTPVIRPCNVLKAFASKLKD